MKKIILGVAAAAMTLSAAAASAQPYYGRGGYSGYTGGYYGGNAYSRDSDRDGRPDYREWNRDRDRDGRPDQYDRYDNRRGGYGYGSSYNSGRGWRQGQVYPYWRNNGYVISNYRAYNLPPPRSGYRYYRSDNGDVVMAAIASGVIGMIIGGALNNDRYDRYDRYGRGY